jgi:hypothetical protein
MDRPEVGVVLSALATINKIDDSNNYSDKLDNTKFLNAVTQAEKENMPAVR